MISSVLQIYYSNWVYVLFMMNVIDYFSLSGYGFRGYELWNNAFNIILSHSDYGDFADSFLCIKTL